MKIIEITPSAVGSHDSVAGMFSTIPEGWAIIPDGMETPNFPFGELTAEEIDGIMTVTSWTPGEMPEPEPTPEPETENDVWEQLDAAYQEGVNSVE